MEQEHIRLRLAEEKWQSKEIADYLGISANVESTRWNRLRKKIWDRWQQYPSLVTYADKIGLEAKEHQTLKPN